MERSTRDDRGGTLHLGTQRKPRAQTDRGGQPTADAAQSSAEQLQQEQQQSRQLRDFAPGEDGECH